MTLCCCRTFSLTGGARFSSESNKHNLVTPPEFFCFSWWRIWSFLWNLKSPDHIPRVWKVTFSCSPPGRSHFTPSRLFRRVISSGNCFHFFLKNFEWQNTVDFWGNICRIFLDWKSLLFRVWWWFLSTATGTHGNYDSYLQSSQDWDLDTSSALCVLFYPILGRAGYEEGQDGGLNSIKSCISPMERVREHKVTPEMLELEKNRNRTGIWGLKPHWRTHTGSHSSCYQQAAKFSMFNPG